MQLNFDNLLEQARKGDINAFQNLFSAFQPQLRSYLYRLTANRSDAEDLTHDAFIRSFAKLHLFKEKSTLKTWVFTIATRLASTHLEKRSRWSTDVSQKAKELVLRNPQLSAQLQLTAETAPGKTYEIKEHIDTCFTCISKTLPLENQVALMLKDVYGFSVSESMVILGRTEGTVKYLLQSARKTMTQVFDARCALVNKQGVCHQCSELNAWFNPRQDQQEALVKLDLAKGSGKYDREKLLQMRIELVGHIDPLRSSGVDLQEALMNCNRMAMGEMEVPGESP